MIKRINAFRIVFNFLLTMVELLIGMHFLINIFGSGKSLKQLVDAVDLALQQAGSFSSVSLANSGIQGPVAALMLILGFMLFSFVLITIVPAATVRKERELEFADD